MASRIGLDVIASGSWRTRQEGAISCSMPGSSSVVDDAVGNERVVPSNARDAQVSVLRNRGIERQDRAELEKAPRSYIDSINQINSPPGATIEQFDPEHISALISFTRVDER